MQNKSVLKRLLRYIRPQWALVCGSLLCAIIQIALTLWSPILIGDAVDYLIGPETVQFAPILKILLILAVITGISALFQWIMAYCNNKISYYTIKNLRRDTFDRLCGMPLRYADTHAHGDIISRMVNDIDVISDGLLQGFTQLFTGIVTILGTIIFMFSINYVIALVVVLLTPLSIFVAAFIAKICAKKYREQGEITGKLSGIVEEMISGRKVVTAFCYESRAEEQFNEVNEELHKVGVKAQFYSSLTNPSTRFVNGIVYAAAGITGALMTVSGNLGMTVGKISSFLTYANQYTKPFNEISGVVTQLQAAFASAARVFAILDEPLEVDDGTAKLIPADCAGGIAIDHVSFSYLPEKPLLQDLNLRVKNGQRIAIVGPTGCGKTTLINLLMRFYDVNQGRISINGVDIREATRSSLRSLYGMVLQETWLFEGTVFDNIAYAKPDATRDEVIAAAKAAHIHSFIKRLPEEYDTVISENGGNISQGQKQLLCIARILLLDPPMLILDEATSSIDTMTEIRIQRAFTKMMQGRTSFVVAHRLSTIKESDVILVMRDGNIIEQGSHDELLAQNGFYAVLYNSQFAKEDQED